MKMDFGDVRSVVDMISDRDWVSVSIILGSIVVALCFGLKWLLFISFAVFYRAYVIHKKDVKIDNLYKGICEKIDEVWFQREAYLRNPFPGPVQIEDLFKWFPKENQNYLKVCWKRLQEEKKIHWDDKKFGGTWVIKS